MGDVCSLEVHLPPNYRNSEKWEMHNYWNYEMFDFRRYKVRPASATVWNGVLGWFWSFWTLQTPWWSFMKNHELSFLFETGKPNCGKRWSPKPVLLPSLTKVCLSKVLVSFCPWEVVVFAKTWACLPFLNRFTGFSWSAKRFCEGLDQYFVLLKWLSFLFWIALWIYYESWFGTIVEIIFFLQKYPQIGHKYQ